MTEGHVYVYAEMLDFPFLKITSTSIHFFLVPLILHFFVCDIV